MRGGRREQGEGALREGARGRAAVTERFHKGFDEALVGGVALGVFGDSEDALDHPDGLLLKAVGLADAVEQVEDRLDAFGAGELLDAFFDVNAVGEEGGEGADDGFSYAIGFFFEQFDERCDCVRGDEAEGGVRVAYTAVHAAFLG